MVINTNPAPDATNLQKNSSTTKQASRSDSTGNQQSSTQSIDASTVSIFASQFSPISTTDNIDSSGADRALGFLQNSILNQPSLALSAQANQIPASVLKLLQP